jgi:hypothetical protein
MRSTDCPICVARESAAVVSQPPVTTAIETPMPAN